MFSRIVGLSLFAAVAAGAQADDGPLGRVQYTEAREHRVEQEVELPGTVEAPRSARVAAEVEGLVVELHAREGQHVKKGQPLISLRTDALSLELKRAQGDRREAEARLALAEAQLERARELVDQQVLSRQQLDDARFEYEAWRGRADRLQAEINRIELDLERSTVKAPFAGVVVSKATEVGEWVGKGATVMELLSPYILEVRVDVPERYYAGIQRDSRARVLFEALRNYELEGKITSLVPRANAQSRTFPLLVQVRNPDGRIGAGMLAKVYLAAGEARAARIVPKDAVISRGQNRYVFLINEEGTVDMVPVTTGVAIGDWVEVDGPINDKAKVVTRGNERIRPGQRVIAEPLSYKVP